MLYVHESPVSFLALSVQICVMQSACHAVHGWHGGCSTREGTVNSSFLNWQCGTLRPTPTLQKHGDFALLRILYSRRIISYKRSSTKNLTHIKINILLRQNNAKIILSKKRSSRNNLAEKMQLMLYIIQYIQQKHSASTVQIIVSFRKVTRSAGGNARPPYELCKSRKYV